MSGAQDPPPPGAAGDPPRPNAAQETAPPEGTPAGNADAAPLDFMPSFGAEGPQRGAPFPLGLDFGQPRGTAIDVLQRSTGEAAAQGAGAAAEELARASDMRWRARSYYPLLQQAEADHRAAAESGLLDNHGRAPGYLDAHQSINKDVSDGKLPPSTAAYIHRALASVQSGAPLPSFADFAGEPPEASALYQAGEALTEGSSHIGPTPEERAAHPFIGSAGNVAGGLFGGLATAAVSGPLAPLTGASYYALQSAGEARLAARAAGASEDAQDRAAGDAFMLGFGAGALDLSAVLRPVERAAPGLRSWAEAKLRQALRSAATLPTTGELQAYLAQQIARDYDPTAHYSFDPHRLIAELLAGALAGPMVRAREPLDLTTRSGLERHADALAIPYDHSTPDWQLRASVAEALGQQTPPEDAAAQSRRVEDALDETARRNGLPWKEDDDDLRGVPVHAVPAGEPGPNQADPASAAAPGQPRAAGIRSGAGEDDGEPAPAGGSGSAGASLGAEPESAAGSDRPDAGPAGGDAARGQGDVPRGESPERSGRGEEPEGETLEPPPDRQDPDEPLENARLRVYTEKEARKLEGPHRGLIFAAETPRGTQEAQNFQAGTAGAFSDIATRKSASPAIRFDNPNPRGVNFIKLDAANVERDISGRKRLVLIDAKTKLPIFNEGAMEDTKATLKRLKLALEQNPELKVVYEFPNEMRASEAMNFLRKHELDHIVEVRARTP